MWFHFQSQNLFLVEDLIVLFPKETKIGIDWVHFVMIHLSPSSHRKPGYTSGRRVR